MKLIGLIVAIGIAAAPAHALAWGNAGHRIVGTAAAQALPKEVPAFVRKAGRDIGELSREPDRSKGAGKVHDRDRDPAHFIDIDDEGKALGGPALSALPGTREDYEKALQAAGQNSWDAGYLPYAIIDRYQQLTLDFAYWRVLTAAEANRAWRKDRAWFQRDRARREAQVLRTIGELSHFVGDGSQPLHVTHHYNGWGDGPNPNGFSTAKLHGPFEGDLVVRSVKPELVAAAMSAPKLDDRTIAARAVTYLTATNALVTPFYEVEKAGGLEPGDTRGPAFATRQLAIGASELRDLIVEAWRDSAASKIGWKPIAVSDVLAGKINPYMALYGVD